MFCRHCGKELNDNELFCTFCGAEIARNKEKTDARNKEESPIHTTLGGTERKSKQMYRSGKRIGIVMTLFFVVLGIVVGFGFYQTSVERYMQTFVNAMVSGHWDEAYSMLPEKDQDETDVQSFQNAYQVLGIVGGTVERKKEYENAVTYEVSFTDDRGKEIAKYQYDVQEQDKKRWLFFSMWSMTASDMVVRDTTILMPKNAAVMIDNEPFAVENALVSELSYEELSTAPAVYQEKWITLEIPAMWAVEHKVKVAEDRFVDYETVWKPKDKESLAVLELQYIETEQWRVWYAEYIKENLDTFVNIEGRAFSDTSYGFFDVDSDGVPEMFTFEGWGTEAVFNHVFTIRDGQIQPYEQVADSMIEDCYFGEMYITTDHRILVARFSSAHEPARGVLIEYTIENGTITEKRTADYTISMSGEEDRHYYNGDKEISKKKFKAILKEQGCEFQGGRIHVYGDALINFEDIMSLSFENYSEEDPGRIDRDLSAYSLLQQ